MCSVDGCENGGKTVRGFCTKHYARWRKHGDATHLERTPAGTPLQWAESHKGYAMDDCLVWPFSRDESGYGQTVYRGKKSKASRVMCFLAHGEPPGDGYQAAHSCGNGHLGCVNPSHLRWATHKENGADMVFHGRSTRGRKNANVWLSGTSVSEIRELCRSGGASQAVIAAKYGVSQSTISAIHVRKNWAWM